MKKSEVYLTELEKVAMNVLANPNGNGEVIDTEYADYIEIFNFPIENKLLRGVLSSLVKKGFISIEYDDVDDIGLMSLVKFTEAGYELAKEFKA